ncbi:hypothetical protein JTB14_033266 [Gonioctena quinquepunctata]|nr:hypothetical protein JTB14_033266 [Gonioctena quinquepunctata]
MENVNQSLSSGASKRRKRKRLEEEISKLPKITTFLIDCSGTTGDEGGVYGRKTEERSKAISLLKSLEQFEFIFILTMCSKILENANIASKLLQLDDLDLSRACKSLESTYTKIKEYRDHYDQLKTEATNVAAKWSIQPKFQEKRNITSKKNFGEPNTQYLFSEREHFFKVNIQYKTLDIVLCQIKNRFEAMNTTVSKFNFLNPKLLVEMSEADLFRSSENLQKLYPSDLSSTFPFEIISLLPLKEEIVKLKDIREFAEFLIIMNYTLSSNFSEFESEKLFIKIKVGKPGLRQIE